MLQIRVQNLILCDGAKILNVADVVCCSMSFTVAAVPKVMSHSMESGTEMNSDFPKRWRDPTWIWGRGKDGKRDTGELKDENWTEVLAHT